MQYSTTLTALSLVGLLSVSTAGQVAFAEASDALKVDATELQLHLLLGQYTISVVVNENDTLSIEGIIDDQEAFNALNQSLGEKTEENGDWVVTNNVVNS